MSAEASSKKSRDWNEALRSFLATAARRDAERRFDWLHAEFLSDAITRALAEELRRGAYARPEEIYEDQDIFHDLSLLIKEKLFGRLIKLWEARRNPDLAARDARGGIDSFHAYVAAVAQNACVDYLRRKHPGRHALDNALRAALDVRSDLALWRTPLDKDTLEWRCGRPEWRDSERFPISLRSGDGLAVHLRSELAGLERAEALARAFEVAQAPLRFTQLLDFLAEYWDMEAVYRNALRERADFRVPKPYLRGIQPEEVVDLMGALQNIWGQVKQLNPAQAAVVLLKVPECEDGSFLDAMVRLRVAAWQDMAQAAGLTAVMLQNLSMGVPLSDREIADALDIAPADVPRIRQDARRRLARLGLSKK